MKKFSVVNRLVITTALFFSLTAVSIADMLIIVHPENTAKIDAKFVKNLYLGKVSKFSDGTAANPVILGDNEKMTQLFLKEIVKQKPTQFKRFWSKALFTGKGTPPQELENQLEMLNLIMTDRTAIGFIHADSFTNDVRAVLRVKMN